MTRSAGSIWRVATRLRPRRHESLCRRRPGREIYETLSLDTADLASARSMVSSLPEPVDVLLMNAGGVGGHTPLATTPAGVTTVFADNVLGHAALLEGLLAERKLTTAALYVGSEAARGVPKLMIKRPTFATSSTDEFAAVIDGSYFHDHKPNVMFAYGQVKYLAALWIAAMARRHPQLRWATVSPGNTTGTPGSRRDAPARTRPHAPRDPTDRTIARAVSSTRDRRSKPH